MVRISLRLVQRSTIFSTPALPSRRLIHASARRLATEVPNDPFADPKFQVFQEKLQSSPQALEAIANVAKVLQSKGIDTTKPPSTMQMMKLGLDSEVRAAVQNMMSECQKAGIELDPSTIQTMAQKFQQK